ncbi:GL11740 [Drosophila persimilis]|uniref:GL11740 n=1 Tax=Drosophila persimilis TaxID=7234 RepID=B4H3J9_DROPE|nr:GL11740 [Drosophila persimilis]
MPALKLLLALLLICFEATAKDLQECEDLGLGSHICREIESLQQLNGYVQDDWRSVRWSTSTPASRATIPGHCQTCACPGYCTWICRSRVA